jgi:hypothetical protein
MYKTWSFSIAEPSNAGTPKLPAGLCIIQAPQKTDEKPQNLPPFISLPEVKSSRAEKAEPLLQRTTLADTHHIRPRNRCCAELKFGAAYPQYETGLNIDLFILSQR